MASVGSLEWAANGRGVALTWFDKVRLVGTVIPAAMHFPSEIAARLADGTRHAGACARYDSPRERTSYRTERRLLATARRKEKRSVQQRCRLLPWVRGRNEKMSPWRTWALHYLGDGERFGQVLLVGLQHGHLGGQRLFVAELRRRFHPSRSNGF